MENDEVLHDDEGGGQLMFDSFVSRARQSEPYGAIQLHGREILRGDFEIDPRDFRLAKAGKRLEH